MSQVTLQVGGRPYTVSCAEGEEDRVRNLAAIVDGKLSSLGGNIAPGDSKNLLFAALLLADEVDEARRLGTPAPTTVLDDSLARGLEDTADQLEKLAGKLESAAPNA